MANSVLGLRWQVLRLGKMTRQQKHKRKDHFVPVFLLRKFADLTVVHKHSPHIWQCDLQTRQSKLAGVRDVAHRSGLYNLDNTPDKLTALNDAYMEIEGRSSALIGTLLALRPIPTEAQRQLLARFLGAQYSRVPRALEIAKSSLEADPQYIPVKKNDILGLSTWVGDRIINLAMQMKWILLVNETQVPFPISDCPVGLLSPGRQRLPILTGDLHSDLEIVCPLSTNFALMLNSDEDRPHWSEQRVGRGWVEGFILNQLIPSADRYMYSSSQAQADWILSHLDC